MICDFCKKKITQPVQITIKDDEDIKEYTICKYCKSRIINIKRSSSKGIGVAVNAGIGTAVRDKKGE